VKLERICRAVRCGAKSVTDLPACPDCGTPYGRFTLGYDRNPDEMTAAETEAERIARFEAEQRAFMRQLADTKARDTQANTQQEEPA
jgi:hypothetical protein